MDQNIIPSPTTIFSEISRFPSKIENLSSSTINEHELISSRDNSFSKFYWNQNSHFGKSSWPINFNEINYSVSGHYSEYNNVTRNNVPESGTIVGSIVPKEGHIYSLAAKSDVLYTGSDTKNIRVWKNMQELSTFKSSSGLVKSIVISGDTIFTGHQDGKVRVWKANQEYPSVHKRSGTLPTFMDILKSSIRPRNYVEVKGNRTNLWIKHCDAISSLSICEEHGLLYSASWDRTIKVWRIENSKCLDSIKAHDDAVNSVVSSVEGIVYSGSADGCLKVWKRETIGKTVKHVFLRNLLTQESAVTALAVNKGGSFVYCGTSKGVVHFWDNRNFRSGVLEGHKLAVLCLTVSGNLVFSGSADKNICVWRKYGRGHSCLAVLRGHDGPVKCLAVEEKDYGTGEGGHFVVYSGSLDKSVRVWSVCDLQEMEILQESRGVGNAGWEKVPPTMN